MFKLKKGHKYMTGITIYNVQRVVTPKAGNSEVWFLYSAHHGDVHLHKVSRKYLKQFSSYRGDTYITGITIFKGHNSKRRLSRGTAPCLMMFYICVKFYQNI